MKAKLIFVFLYGLAIGFLTADISNGLMAALSTYGAIRVGEDVGEWLATRDTRKGGSRRGRRRSGAISSTSCRGRLQ